MYSKTWFALPLAVKLSNVTLPEDLHLDGDLQDEYSRAVGRAVGVRRNKKLRARISTTYSKGTSLWEVTNDILERFHLIPIVTVDGEDVYVRFDKGSAWKER